MIESINELREICFKDPDKYGKIPFISRAIIHPYVSIYVTKLLILLGLSGLQATVLMLFINVSALFFLFLGYTAIGGGLLLLGWILDHSDGEVCRYRNESTALGIFLDCLTHRLTYPGIYLGLGYCVSVNSGMNYFYLGAGASYFMSLNIMNRLDKRIISSSRKDIKYCYSVILEYINNCAITYNSKIVMGVKYFYALFLSGYGVIFNLLLIVSSLFGFVQVFFIFMSIIVIFNALFSLYADQQYTFKIKGKDLRGE
nr:CDP-alcohol phosphatidyltransferase family protein [uncultured Desulfobacter sp.]